MARDENVVSIIADNVAHVRLVPDGKTADDVKEEFWEARAMKKLKAEGRVSDVIQEMPMMKTDFPPGLVTKKIPITELTAKVSKADINGPGPCPFCGKIYKNRRPHVPHCKKGPGGAL